MLKQALLGGAKVMAKGAVYGAAFGTAFGLGVVTCIKIVEDEPRRRNYKKGNN